MEKTMSQQRKTSRKPAAQATAMQEAKSASAPKKSAPRSKKNIVTPEMRHQMISDAAYFRAENRGSPNGEDHIDDWLAAEAEIDAMLSRSGKLS